MRHGGGIYTAASSLLCPSPSPSVLQSPIIPFPTTMTNHNMLLSFFVGLFLPCAGMSAVLIVYICLVWYRTNNSPDIPTAAKAVAEKGLSPSELQKLPRISGKELVMGTECAVCLEEIGSDQEARMVPGCNHGFHLECADSWLSKRPVCPLCRITLDGQLFAATAITVSDDHENPC